MSKIAAAVLGSVCFLLFAMPVSAQILPHGNVYVGGVYERSDIVINTYDLRGWNGSLEDIPFPNYRFLGIAIEGAGVYRPGITQYTLVLGPRIAKTYGKWRPFLHAFGGAQRITTSGNAYNPVAVQFGGGADYKLFFRNFSWRVQLDYIHTRYLSARESTERVSTGLVWRF